MNDKRSCFAGLPHLAANIVLIGLITFALSGCDVLAPPEPVTITFTIPERMADYYEGLIEPFNERYAHITVELVINDPDDENLTTDTAMVWGIPSLLEQDAILPLDPLIAEDRSFDLVDFYPVAVDAHTYEGQTWAIPAAADPVVMFYNEIRFDEAGIPYPEANWTWDDLLDAAQAVRNPMNGTFGCGYGYWGPLTLIYQHGGQIVDDLVNPTRTTFDDPLTIEALQWYADLAHVYDVAPSSEQISKWGEWGMHGAWWGSQLGSMSSNLSNHRWIGRSGIQWGVVPLPREARSTTWVSIAGYVISAESAHPEAAWRWIAFLSEQVPEDFTPTRPELLESAEYAEEVGEDMATAARESMEHGFTFAPKVWMELGDAWSIFWDAVDKVQSGESTPQEALSQAQQEAESLAP